MKLSFISSTIFHAILFAILFIFMSNMVTPHDELAKAETIQVMLIDPLMINQENKITNIKPIDTAPPPIVTNARVLLPSQEKKVAIENKLKNAKKTTEVARTDKKSDAAEKPKEISNQGELEDPKKKMIANKTQSASIDGSAVDSHKLIAGYSDAVVRMLQPEIRSAQIGQAFDPKIKIIIKVYLSSTATVQRIKVIKTSRSLDFDMIVDKVIRSHSTFPKFPEGAKYEDYKEIILTFKPE